MSGRGQKLRRKFWSRNTLQDGPDGPNGPNGHAAMAAKPTATARMWECLRATQGLSAKDQALKPCVPRVKRHKTIQKTCGYHGHSALCQTTKKGVKRGKKIAMPCDCRSPAGKPWQKISKIFPQKSGEIFETFCHIF